MGDVVMVQVDEGSAPQLSPVVEVWQAAAVGAFNPFVRGADLIVDGVVGGAALAVLALTGPRRPLAAGCSSTCSGTPAPQAQAC